MVARNIRRAVICGAAAFVFTVAAHLPVKAGLAVTVLASVLGAI